MTQDLLWIEKNHGTAIDVNSILFPHLWEWHSKTLVYWWFRTSTYYHRANCNNLAAKCDYIILADHWPLPFYSAVANPNDFTNSPDSALIQKNGGWWSHSHTPPICAFQSADSPLGPRARDRSINASKDVPLKSPGAPLRPSNLLQSVRDCNKWESVLQQSPTPKSKGINLSQKSDFFIDPYRVKEVGCFSTRCSDHRSKTWATKRPNYFPWFSGWFFRRDPCNGEIYNPHLAV